MAIGFLDHIHGMNKKYPTGGAGFFRFADDFFVDSAAGFRGAICKLGGAGERPTCSALCRVPSSKRRPCLDAPLCYVALCVALMVPILHVARTRSSNLTDVTPIYVGDLTDIRSKRPPRQRWVSGALHNGMPNSFSVADRCCCCCCGM